MRNQASNRLSRGKQGLVSQGRSCKVRPPASPVVARSVSTASMLKEVRQLPVRERAHEPLSRPRIGESGGGLLFWLHKSAVERLQTVFAPKSRGSLNSAFDIVQRAPRLKRLIADIQAGESSVLSRKKRRGFCRHHLVATYVELAARSTMQERRCGEQSRLAVGGMAYPRARRRAGAAGSSVETGAAFLAGRLELWEDSRRQALCSGEAPTVEEEGEVSRQKIPQFMCLSQNTMMEGQIRTLRSGAWRSTIRCQRSYTSRHAPL